MSDPLALSRHRLREAVARIETLRGEGAAVLYKLGLVLREVYDEALWQAGGYSSFSAWVEEEAEVSRGTAARAIEVTRHFNEDIAARYGLEKLYWGLRYLQATRAVEQPGDLIAADLRLRGEHGRFTSVPFHTATLRQVQEATRLALDLRQRALPHRVEPTLKEQISRLSEALPPTPAGMSPARQRVEVARTRDGKVALTFRQIPVTELRAFLDAVEREMLGNPTE